MALAYCSACGFPYARITLKKILLLLRWVFVAVRGLSVVAASEGSSLAAVCGLLIAVAPLGAEHGF